MPRKSRTQEHKNDRRRALATIDEVFASIPKSEANITVCIGIGCIFAEPLTNEARGSHNEIRCTYLRPPEKKLVGTDACPSPSGPERGN